MCIEGIRMHLEADEYFDIKIGDTGTPISGSAITPANLNAGSGNIATGTFKNGNTITGLSGGTTIERIYHENAKDYAYTNFEQDIILPKNSTLTSYIESGSVALSGTLVFNYHGNV